MYTRDEYNDLVLQRAGALLEGMYSFLDDCEDDDEPDNDDFDQDLEDALAEIQEVLDGHGHGSAELDTLVDKVAAIYTSHYAGRTEPEIALPEAPGRVAVTVRLELDLTPEQAATLFKEATAQLEAADELGEVARLICTALEPQTELFGRLL